MAASRKEAGPEMTFIDFTCPDASTRASRVTMAVLLLSKYRSELGEAIARTDLINLGGTWAALPEADAAETSDWLLEERGTGCLDITGVIGDSCPTTGVPAADALGLVASRTDNGEDFAAPAGAGCDALGSPAIG